MSSRLAGKVAIITGAGKGIGKVVAQLFAKEGAKVVVVSLHEETGAGVCGEIRRDGGEAMFVRADVSKQADMERMIEKTVSEYGTVHILCHNAGIYPLNLLKDMTENEWDSVLDVNLKGVFLAVKACLPAMMKQNYGKIVITSSITGPRTAFPGNVHYGSAKAGILGFIHNAAIELAKYHITINALEPAWTLTPGLRDQMSPEEIKVIAKSIPMGELADPLDTAYASLFFSTDESRFITGQSLIIDGGLTLVEIKSALD
ncbi:MAG: SDR family oxidoreductase [Thaumarchaeota archaeon]|nr:SDR family oxidoreductase [Nitrososphaerota archaeon]